MTHTTLRNIFSEIVPTEKYSNLARTHRRECDHGIDELVLSQQDQSQIHRSIYQIAQSGFIFSLQSWSEVF